MDGREQDAIADSTGERSMPIEISTESIVDAVASRLIDSGVVLPRLLTLDQASKYLGLTKEALKAKVHIGRVPTVGIDKKLRFDRLDLDRMIEQNKRVG
jgi:excisionase family DNA binding protein